MHSSKIKKIVITGPECTGKSDLSLFLAKHFNTEQVSEYARCFIDNLRRPYVEADLKTIAIGQVKSEEEKLSRATDILICDTDLITIKIWSYFNYGRCDEEILQLISSQRYDLHLLTYIDVPWEEDPQREHSKKRKILWRLFKKELENKDIPYVDIRGSRERRRKTAIRAIEEMSSR